VVHVCNPSYSEEEIRRIVVQNQPGQIVYKVIFQKKPITKRKKGEDWWSDSRCRP
jgi:hypothetical protein